MDDKLMYLFNADRQNYPFYRLKLLVEKLKRDFIEVPKVFNPMRMRKPECNYKI